MCFCFLSLRENWLCSAKSLFTSFARLTAEELHTFSSAGMSSLALKLALFRQNEISSFGDGDPRNATPFQYITGAAARNEGRLSQLAADTASFYFREA
jgi:hypothetical protein